MRLSRRAKAVIARMEQEDDILYFRNAAKELGVNPMTIKKWIKDPYMPLQGLQRNVAGYDRVFVTRDSLDLANESYINQVRATTAEVA